MLEVDLMSSGVLVTAVFLNLTRASSHTVKSKQPKKHILEAFLYLLQRLYVCTNDKSTSVGKKEVYNSKIV
jgi:hypothetical protein